MKTVMKTFMVGEKSRKLSVVQTTVSWLLGAPMEAFGWWNPS
jgi:hypothetical protein